MALQDDDHEIVQKIIAHLGRKGIQPLRCIVCSTIKWKVLRVIFPSTYDDVSDPASPDSYALRRRGDGLPMVPLVCENCGFVYQFDYRLVRNDG